MNTHEFHSLAERQLINRVRFIESSCSPLVIELDYKQENQASKALLKSNDGQVITCKNVTQAYDICRAAGIHKAELVQVIPHDEACAGNTLAAEDQSIPLTF